MNNQWMGVALVIGAALLCLLPLVPALVELYWKTDGEPLTICQNHDGHVHHFARSFRQYLNQQAPGRVLEREGSAYAEGRFPDGTRFRLLRDGVATEPESWQFLPSAKPPVVLASEPVFVPARAILLQELYAAQELEGGPGNHYCAILGRKWIHLGGDSTVYRWVHSDDALRVGANSTLHGRASAE